MRLLTISTAMMLALPSCGKPRTRVIKEAPEACLPVMVTEVEVVEVEHIIERVIEKDTPLYFVGNYCSKTVLEHDGTNYLIHNGLMPLRPGFKVEIGSCEIRINKDSEIREVRP